MSAAIKRLSTIIRPHPHTQASSASPQKESPKPQPSAVSPTDTENKPGVVDSSAPVPTTMSTTTEAPADSSADATVAPAGDSTIAPSSAPEQPTTQEESQAMATPVAVDAPATTEKAQETPAPTEPVPAEEKTEDAPATKTSDTKHETTSVKEKSRRTRDIGRETIRRFSTILRPGNGSHTKEKDVVPPVPTPASKAKEEEAPKAVEATPAADTDIPAATVAASTTEQPEPAATPAVVEKQEKPQESKPVKAAKSAAVTPKTKEKEKEKTEKPKTAARRGSSFFSAARDAVRGPRRDASKSKPVAAPKAESAAVKIIKKGAAKGKRVVVITGASKGTGLELVKQYSVQPDTFVIALSRTVDKAAEIRTIVNESAKYGHNVRPVRVDIGSTKSIASAVKDIVELTDGRIDLVIHAAGTKHENPIRIGDIKGPELEEELRYNLVGPIAFTNALLQYLKPFPPPPPAPAPAPATTEVKETEEANNAVAPMETDKAEKTEESKEAKADVVAESKPEIDTEKDTSALPKTTEEEANTAPVTQDTTPAVPAEAEQTSEPVAELAPAAQSTIETPSATEPVVTEGEAKQPDAETAAAVPLPADSTPAPPVDSTEPTPAPAPVPVYLPPNPCVIFLTPSDPIYNSQGSVPGGSFVPSPKTLFSLSRSALQVAIAKYAMSLGGQAINVVGIERPGVLDPHSNIAEAQAVKSILEYLPDVTLNKSGRLLRI